MFNGSSFCHMLEVFSHLLFPLFISLTRCYFFQMTHWLDVVKSQTHWQWLEQLCWFSGNNLIRTRKKLMFTLTVLFFIASISSGV